jgi:UDP-GlcNAc:undecaprenyl-phosphate/decaprenyl-phosphate GlcNAc-1-phosphate transferase
LSDVALFFLALAVALVLTPLLIVVARRTGVVDRPGSLKPQTVAVPYLGGVAVFAGTAIGVGLGRPSVLIALGAALALGVADDRFDLSPWIRLAGQVLVGVAVAVTCPVRLGGVTAAACIIVASVILINGVNLMDGLDMLAAGVALVAAAAFAILLTGWSRQTSVALTASLAGFLVFNRPPARIYLGDGGSYLIGTALAVLLAATWAPGVPNPRGVAALAIVAMPAAELTFAVVRRTRGRRSLMAGDRGHPYDRLVGRGWPRPAASLAYIALESVIAVAAVLAGRRAPVPVAVAIDLAAAVLLIAGALLTGALTPDLGAPT